MVPRIILTNCYQRLWKSSTLKTTNLYLRSASLSSLRSVDLQLLENFVRIRCKLIRFKDRVLIIQVVWEARSNPRVALSHQQIKKNQAAVAPQITTKFLVVMHLALVDETRLTVQIYAPQQACLRSGKRILITFPFRLILTSPWEWWSTLENYGRRKASKC